MGVKIPAAFEDATGTITRLTGEIELELPATPGQVLTANNPATSASFAAGGGGSIVSCVTYITATDVHTQAVHGLNPTGVFDNIWDSNPLGAIPDGLGLDFAVDGSSKLITVTEAGVYAFTLNVTYPGDLTLVGIVTDDFGLGSATPPQPTDGGKVTLTEVLALPAGAQGGFSWSTLVAGTANPCNVAAQLILVRLG